MKIKQSNDIMNFKDSLQKWTRSELERFAYLHLKKGLDYMALRSHFNMTRDQYQELHDIVLLDKSFRRWKK